MGVDWLLGDVNNGWFAQTAHWVEDRGRDIGNFFTGGSGGDQFYDRMGEHAQTYVENINNNVIAEATAAGATPQQALQAGSAAMERLVHPQTAGDVLDLVGAGGSVATTTTVEAVQDALPSFGEPDLSGLMVAGLALGGTLLACEAYNGRPSSTPSAVDRERDRDSA